jgi:hypothetical protein
MSNALSQPPNTTNAVFWLVPTDRSRVQKLELPIWHFEFLGSMTDFFNFTRARPLLQTGDFVRLFVEELGWAPCRQKLTLRSGETDYAFTALAGKRGSSPSSANRLTANAPITPPGGGEVQAIWSRVRP